MGAYKVCGICGVLSYEGNAFEVTGELIAAMRDSMVHRGPDDAGLYISSDKKLGLGHRRLSILDLSAAGHQPMCNEDGTVWIVFNGEIYNQKELRQGLELRGHRFKSRTDTETVIHLYEEKGKDCVQDLDGMFAFAIWDSRRGLLTLTRDRLGEKPLYYSVQNGELIFASEIKAILKYPGVRREVDTEALYHYLTLYVTPAPMTLFKGINKLPAGYLLVCDKEGNIREEQYWDAIVPPPAQDYPEEYYVSETRRLLSRSIERRMMSDVPFGVFLSGGMDSSTNVALMSELTPQPVNTFSVGFPDQPAYNEFNYARQVASEFRTNHHEIVINHRDLMDYVPRLVYHQDEPIADWVCVPLFFLSKLARDNGVIVVQIGEGSDELFFGYDGYMTYLNVYKRFWKPYMRMPRALRKMVYSLSSPLSPFVGKGPGVRGILRSAALDEELFWGGAIAFSEAQKRVLMKGSRDGQGLNSFDIVKQSFARFDRQKPQADFVERMTYLELKHRLPELLLMRVDKVTMSASVEGRAPYLSPELVEFAMGIPSRLKIKNGQKKYILKKAVEGIIPDNIIYRKKQGFGVPVREWFSGELGDYISHSILNSRIRERKFFDYECLEKMLERQKDGTSDQSARLWIIFNLSRWYDYWIAGEDK
ncbi:MAG: asparagine synthase (glutamine-hydrolyzing) [Chloroflexota bacterium]